jgi:PAS domain S-box-containing protein
MNKQTGYACDAVVGQTLADIFPPAAGDGSSGMVEQLRLAGRDGWHLDEMWRGRKDGSRYWCQLLIAARVDDDGKVAGYTLVLREITRQTYDTNDLRRLLTQDHLTGAANRARFQQLFEREHRAWRKNGALLSLIMLDIDHFKHVNDTYGHATGDLVLSRFAKTIAKAIRPTDVLARLGGEEFAVLFPASETVAGPRRRHARRNTAGRSGSHRESRLRDGVPRFGSASLGRRSSLRRQAERP